MWECLPWNIAETVIWADQQEVRGGGCRISEEKAAELIELIEGLKDGGNEFSNTR